MQHISFVGVLIWLNFFRFKSFLDAVHSSQCHSNRTVVPMLPWDNITMALVAITDLETKSIITMHCVIIMTLSRVLDALCESAFGP